MKKIITIDELRILRDAKTHPCEPAKNATDLAVDAYHERFRTMLDEIKRLRIED